MVSDCSQTESWILAAQGGDRVALAKLLTTCHPQLRARALAEMDETMRARSGPDDLLQEVYIDVARQIVSFDNRGPGAFHSWLYAILGHKLTDARRAAYSQKRDARREVRPVASSDDSYWNLLDNLYVESGTPSRVIRREEALGALLSCVTNLSEAHRQVIQLRYLNGLSVDETAKRMGKTSGAVVALSKRALAALRNSMDQLGEFTHGGA